ncbi:MAG TPA: prepilin-type N-terminal cleavage/methylation domain-containing protein [Candidatus Xenobia bacterium]
MQRKLLARLGRVARRGFSLVEVIFAASLLSLVMLMMFNLYPTSLLTIRQAEHRLQANSLAQAVLESYRAGPFASTYGGTATVSPGVVNSFQSPSGLPSYGIDGVQYWTEALASPSIDGAGSCRLVDLRVTCFWDERSDHEPGQWPANAGNLSGTVERWHHLTQELYICDIQR